MSKLRTSDAAQLEYRVVSGHEPAVILLASWGFDGSAWDRVVDAWPTPRPRLLIPDRRGCGGSRGDMKDFSLERVAKDVIEILDAEKVDRALVVGHSMGGKVARYVGCKYPERVSGVALLTPAPPAPMQPPPEFLQLMRSIPGNWQAMEQLIAASRQIEFNDEQEAFAKSCFDACDPKALAELLENVVLKEEFVSELSKTPGPTLVMATDDPVFNLDYHRQQLEMAPRSTLVHLPGVGHWVPFVQPERLAAVIGAFYGGLQSA